MKRFSLNVWRKNEPDQLPSPIREVGAHRQHRRPNLRPNVRKSPTPSTATSPDPSSRPFVTSSTASSFRPRSRRRTSSRVRWPRACWSSFQSLEEGTSRGLPAESGTDAGSASTGRQGASALGRRNQEPKLLENDRPMRLDRWIPKRRPESWHQRTINTWKNLDRLLETWEIPHTFTAFIQLIIYGRNVSVGNILCCTLHI